MTQARPTRSLTPWRALIAVVVVGVAAAAWLRVGLLDLPSIPSSVTAKVAGLDSLAEYKMLDEYLRGGEASKTTDFSEAARLVHQGIEAVAHGDPQRGLDLMRQGLRLEPDNLVLANAYRMETFQLIREFQKKSTGQSQLVATLPKYLDKQPFAFLEELVRAHQSRETQLSLAMAWVDWMLLYPALEIKAPASVEAVKILTAVLDGGDENYVPALFARGMNHLHRPTRLVWPEADKYPIDAAAQDIGRCVAIGRKLDVGSARLSARLAMALGDAYVKVGRNGNARSWWQVAENLCRDTDVREAVRRRYSWRDEEIIDRLEEELDRDRTELDRPMTDLAFVWR